VAHAPPTYANHLILAQTVLQHTGTSRQMLITSAHVEAATPNTLTCANSILEAFLDMLQPQMDNNVTIGPTLVRHGTGTDVPEVAISNIATVTGGAASNSMPANCNILVKKGTGLAGRRNRGRWFIPWMIDQVNCDELGVINPASVVGLQPLFTTGLADFSTADVTIVIGGKTVSIPLPPAKPFISAYFIGEIVTSLTVEGTIASQRRRIGR
jgi:hypothetical protein